MQSQKVKFEYPIQQIQEPIVSTLVKKFDVAPNILSANIVPSKGGWLLVELLGEPDQIEKALAWTASQGITITQDSSV
jgi:D-methionine transport system ATP-binding protein